MSGKKAKFWIEVSDLLAMREFVAGEHLGLGALVNLRVEVEEDPATAGLGRIITLVATNGHLLAVYKPLFEHPPLGDGGLDPGKYLLPLRDFEVMLFEGKKAHKDGYRVLVEITPEQVQLSLVERGLSMVRKVDQDPAEGMMSFPAWEQVVPKEEKFQPVPAIAFDAEYARRVAKAAHHAGFQKAILRYRFTSEAEVFEIRVNSWGGFVAYLMPCRWMDP